MNSKADSPEAYIAQLPEGRKAAVSKLRQTINDNLPEGFGETMSYGMIGWVVPKSIYPAGYHADPDKPLPFINLASQKSHIALYHLCVYADNGLLEWFKSEYSKHSQRKLDMGKSCIRFKKPEQIPYELIAGLVKKITPADWIKIYEEKVKR